MTRRRWMFAVGLVLVQIAALGAYFAVDRWRTAAAQGDLGTAAPRDFTGSVATFAVTTGDGGTREIVTGDRPVLVHFWATWCEPCRDELPLVLEIPGDAPFEVVAVALDDDWAAVDEFVGRRHPRVVLGNRALAEELFDISSLPQTILMSPRGELRLRVNGVRNWSDPEYLRLWTR